MILRYFDPHIVIFYLIFFRKSCIITIWTLEADCRGSSNYFPPPPNWQLGYVRVTGRVSHTTKCPDTTNIFVLRVDGSLLLYLARMLYVHFYMQSLYTNNKGYFTNGPTNISIHRWTLPDSVRIRGGYNASASRTILCLMGTRKR